MRIDATSRALVTGASRGIGYHGGERAAPPERLAEAIIAAVEADRRILAWPREVRLLGLNALAPRLTDALLRRLRGSSAAPRRD